VQYVEIKKDGECFRSEKLMLSNGVPQGSV